MSNRTTSRFRQHASKNLTEPLERWAFRKQDPEVYAELSHQIDKRQKLLFLPLALLFAALTLCALIRTSFDDSMKIVHSLVCTLLAQAWILPLVLGKMCFP